ncbi:MAG: LPS-assembly protein LptD [Arcobacteraceae bacterium]|nr:LPS-assembly protein LptD [Arcobacteraceae bacterium]
MLKKLYLFLALWGILFSSVNAEIIKDGDKLQLLATIIETKDNIITASGDALLHSPQYYITAQKIIYDKENFTVELFDNVNIIKDGKMITFSDYAFLDFSKDIDKFTPIFLMDNTNNIWINSTQSNKSSDLIKFETSTLSSCDCYDPAWSIGFSSGDYNTTEQWLNTYNATLFINQIPILYTPYFGFSTDETRRSGLLKPTIGYSNIEGFLYAQPIFYAPKLNWDIEYIPQVRTTRGYGHQIGYRLKDSDVSSLEFNTGLFKENNKYFRESSLINQKHYGWDFIYERGEVLSNDNTQDGLLVSLHGLNDIDYINTQAQNNSTLDKKLVESKIKYFYNTDDIYADIDFKYYKDTSKTTDEEHGTTMHELPKIHLHKYSTQTFIDEILYSADIRYSNKTRTKGLKANTTDIFIPFTYSLKLLDDYLNFSFSEQFTLIDIKYGNNPNGYADGKFIENKHILTLSTDLLKAYKDYIHTVNFKTSLTIPNIIKQDGDLYSVTNSTADLDVFPVTKTKKNIGFSLNQSIYDKENVSKIINHKINQSIIYNDDETHKLSDLENELILYYKYGQLSNRILYNHQDKVIINSSTSASFNKDDFTSNIYYSYSKDTSLVSSNSESYTYRDLPDAESVTLQLGYKFNKYYQIAYKEEYDLVTEISKLKEYTFGIDKKCWALNLKLADNLVASATTNDKAIRQNVIYIEFTLKPIITINQTYIQKKREK